MKGHKCPSCKLVSAAVGSACPRCGTDLLIDRTSLKSGGSSLKSFVIRIATCFLVCLLAVIGFYLSLLISAGPLTPAQRAAVLESRQIVRERGFTTEGFLLDHLAVYRANDNWLNSTVAKEIAYAATNFPFGIVTIYPDFITYPLDSTERAAILLHEARHMRGADEKEAYEFVWRNREKLGWTRDRYLNSPIWTNIRRQTREYAPELFVCPANDFADCTETPKP